MIALKEVRNNKFGHNSVWTADRKIMHKDDCDTKVKVYFDWGSDKQKLCYGRAGINFAFW